LPTHDAAPVVDVKVPDGQRLHVAEAADVAVFGPNEPAGQGVPKHAPRPDAFVKVPDGQREHDASVLSLMFFGPK
jgi:hypothetical protein